MAAAWLQSLRTLPRQHAAALGCQVKAGGIPVKSVPPREKVCSISYHIRHKCAQHTLICKETQALARNYVSFNGIHDFSHLMVPEAYPLLCPNEGYQRGPDDHPKGMCVINTVSSLSYISFIVVACNSFGVFFLPL